MERGKPSPARRYTPSQRAEALEYAAKHGVSAAQRELGISRFSVYQWRRKAERAAQGVDGDGNPRVFGEERGSPSDIGTTC